MEDVFDKLRKSEPQTFKDLLRSYLLCRVAALGTIPPSEREPLAFARIVSRDPELCELTRKTLPALMAELRTVDSDLTIERAMLLFGFCRAGEALQAAIALTEELERRGRNVDVCFRALAVQAPTEALLEFLLRKGAHPERRNVCLRAMFRLDRGYAAKLLAQLPWGKGRDDQPHESPLSEAFLRSALDVLLVDERIDLMKALYVVRPALPQDFLRQVEAITDAKVIRSQDNSLFMIEIQGQSVAVSTSDRHARTVLQSAAERTSAGAMWQSLN